MREVPLQTGSEDNALGPYRRPNGTLSLRSTIEAAFFAD